MNREELKEAVNEAISKWESVRPFLETAYERWDPERLPVLVAAADRLEVLVRLSGTEENRYTGRIQYVLAPNNYEERIEFVKEKKTSHYALVQLAMLYEEVQKKAARLHVQK